jgi:hypothetical protein
VKFGTAWKTSQQVAVELLFDLQGLVLQHEDSLCLVTLVDFLVHALFLNNLFSDMKRPASATFVQRRSAIGRLHPSIQAPVFSP